MNAIGPPLPLPTRIGPRERWLFAWFHPPTGSAHRRCGVVLCNPIGDDYVRSHRAFRHLAERLAAEGFPTLRFDFHGTGDSSGDEWLPGRARAWVEDVGHAADALQRRAPVEELCFVGLRLGATLAAVAAAERGGVDSLVLWNPYPSGGAFVAESLRLQKMHKLIEPRAFASGPASYPDGDEALGFFLTSETERDLRALDLLALDRRPARRCLVVGGASASVDAPLVARLGTLDVDVTFQLHAGHKFLIGVPHDAEVPFAPIDAIAGWLSGAHALTAPASPEIAEPTRNTVPEVVSEPALPDEEPQLFGSRHRLFGVLTRPAQRRADLPAVVLLSAGTVHRIGPHRLYTAIARRLAGLGFPVLRMDLSGIGDSPPALGSAPNLCYPPSAVDDAGQAMSHLQASLGVQQFVLAGLCSGGDIAFRRGLEDRRVTTALMMNPRTFYVNDAEMVAAYWRAHLAETPHTLGSGWLETLRGEVDLRQVPKLVLPRLRWTVLPRARRILGRARPDAITDVPRCLRLMAERGVDTLLLVTEQDPGIAFVDEQFGREMRELDGLSGYRLESVPGTDHTFSSLWAQRRVSDVIAEHLARRYLG